MFGQLNKTKQIKCLTVPETSRLQIVNSPFPKSEIILVNMCGLGIIYMILGGEERGKVKFYSVNASIIAEI